MFASAATFFAIVDQLKSMGKVQEAITKASLTSPPSLTAATRSTNRVLSSLGITKQEIKNDTQRLAMAAPLPGAGLLLHVRLCCYLLRHRRSAQKHGQVYSRVECPRRRLPQVKEAPHRPRGRLLRNEAGDVMAAALTVNLTDRQMQTLLLSDFLAFELNLKFDLLSTLRLGIELNSPSSCFQCTFWDLELNIKFELF
ncbi:hypothetical protein GOP47_0009555 [Adiantum capillus-veneris]|uniref:Uncharacterized protein n=1 Tax=Adiantum capillus-veneris TaxID=13818 RepID=A0A9D4UX32_ADICA|nr:hypothetical protein GOP47_0009555 [Adiantum capillus-veneris]